MNRVRSLLTILCALLVGVFVGCASTAPAVNATGYSGS